MPAAMNATLMGWLQPTRPYAAVTGA